MSKIKLPMTAIVKVLEISTHASEQDPDNNVLVLYPGTHPEDQWVMSWKGERVDEIFLQVFKPTGHQDPDSVNAKLTIKIDDYQEGWTFAEDPVVNEHKQPFCPRDYKGITITGGGTKTCKITAKDFQLADYVGVNMRYCCIKDGKKYYSPDPRISIAHRPG